MNHNRRKRPGSDRSFSVSCFLLDSLRSHPAAHRCEGYPKWRRLRDIELTGHSKAPCNVNLFRDVFILCGRSVFGGYLSGVSRIAKPFAPLAFCRSSPVSLFAWIPGYDHGGAWRWTVPMSYHALYVAALLAKKRTPRPMHTNDPKFRRAHPCVHP